MGPWWGRWRWAERGGGVVDAEQVRVGDPDPTPELEDVSAYCWAPHRLVGRTGYCSWAAGHDGDHVTADVGVGVVAVYADAAPPVGRVWSPRDLLPWVVGPGSMGLSDGAWTDGMVRAGAVAGVNRQCSIGWHAECSDPGGERCRCACHGEQGGGR
jgi:hypothetical protein